MNTRVQDEWQHTVRYSQLPVQWYLSRNGKPLSLMSWRVEWPAQIRVDMALDVLVRVQALFSNWDRERVPPALTNAQELEAPIALDRAVAHAANGLQVAASPALSTWIASVCGRGDLDGLSYPFLDEIFAQEVGQSALNLVSGLVGSAHLPDHQKEQQSRQILDRVQATLKLCHPPEGSTRILAEAQSRGIPTYRLAHKLPAYQLGQGVRQHRLWRGFTSATSHLGTVLATQKVLTNDLLRQSGLPVPDQHVVVNLDSALAAAQQIGWPVVVKPASTDYGIAVTADIGDPAVLRDAFNLAQTYGAVLIERHIEGTMHRLGVIDGKCLWVARTLAPQCESDGRHSVAELVTMMNDARGHNAVLHGFSGVDVRNRQVLDMLARQGLCLEDVPPPGKTIIFLPHANISTGATRELVTDAAHPDNLKLAERAAAVVGLDVAGIDFITRDIARSWMDVGGGICEVNPTPGMPDKEAPGWLLDYLFPLNSQGRIPIVLVIGDSQSVQTVHAELVRTAGKFENIVGACRNGAVYLNYHKITAVPTALSRALRIVITEPTVAAIFIHVSSSELQTDELILDYCDLAIVWLTAQEHKTFGDRAQQLHRSAAEILHQPPAQVAITRCQELLERHFR